MVAFIAKVEGVAQENFSPPQTPSFSAPPIKNPGGATDQDNVRSRCFETHSWISVAINIHKKTDSTMSYLINHARLKQLSITITLLDLKNAFGEVHHELLRSVLKYHHIPREIEKLIFLLYKDFHIAISANNFTTPLIHVQKGVLQEDCLSPLLFNMCVNTLIKTIDNEKLKCLGYVYDNTITHKHWFQSADDTAIVTALESDNQLLVNVFSKWSQWADLKVRVDKCHVFGMKKEKTEAKQYLPKIIINRERIPPVEMDKSFDYLGKTFSLSLQTSFIAN